MNSLFFSLSLPPSLSDNIPPGYPMNNSAIRREIRDLTTMVNTAFDQTMIFPLLGNHDVYQADQMPTNLSFYETFLNHTNWSYLLHKEKWKTGFYSRNLNDKIKIIVLNTCLYYNNDKSTISDEDPGGQFDWLTNQLKRVKAQKMKVKFIENFLSCLKCQRFHNSFLL